MTTRRRAPVGLVLIGLVVTALSWPGAVAAVDNAPPVAVDDPAVPSCAPSNFGGSFPIPEDYGQFTFAGPCSAVANDLDSDGTIVAWKIVTAPGHGTLEYLGGYPSAFGYTPAPNWSTPAGTWLSDSFTYQAIDNLGATSNVATYKFWIAPFNDPPTFTVGPSPVNGVKDTAYSLAWATNVSPGPPNESGQTVHFERTNIAYHGNPGLFGTLPEIAPDGMLSFTPAPNQVGSATVTFVAKDDGGLEHYLGVPDAADDTSDPVSFDITIAAANSVPVANDDVTTVVEDSSANPIPVLANDTDSDGDTLTIIGTGAASQGFAKPLADGSAMTYTPNPNANGTDSFNYTISDGHGGTAMATVHVTITPVNDPPDAVDDGVPTPISIAKGAGPVPIAVLANDTSAPDSGETLLITSVTQATHGAVAIGAGGTSLTYDPAGQITGSDSFTYTISDGNGGTDTATVQVVVAKEKRKP